MDNTDNTDVFTDEWKITVEKWGGRKHKTTVRWREVADLYTSMRQQIIADCPRCHKPSSIYDEGKYCDYHAKYERLDDIIADIFIP